MHTPANRAGRRRAQATRRLPNLTAAFSSLSRPTLVKGLAGLGLATSVAAAVAIPVQATPGQLEVGDQTTALMARDRVEAAKDTTSRSSGRTSVSGSGVALTAPAAAQSAAVRAGTAGVTAVAKPKPKPKPTEAKPEPTRTQERSSGSSGSSSNEESTPTTSGSGVSMAYYGWCNNKGLGDNASKVCSAVRSNFGVTNIGGYRAGAGDHGTGRAVDIMVGRSTGDAVAQWAINNMGSYNITYVIWRQRIWLAGASGWRAMEDRGSVTANHYDHVHISVE